MNKERKEALMRIPIGIIYALIGYFWGILAAIVAVLNFFYTLFAGKRNKNLSDFANNYVTFMYHNLRYMMFTTNQRPWPFTKLKEIEKTDYKFQN